MDENGRIPADGHRKAVAQREAMLADNAQPRGGSTWFEHGPNNVGGRTRSILIHPQETNRMWAGAVSGGIWYSTDSGQSWTPVNDWLPNLAICCLAMDPNNPDVMYAGTGEGFFNGDAIGGAGIYKSSDGGVNWYQLPATADWDNVNRIAISPDDSEVVLAARRYGGIYRSTNGGDSWTNPRFAQGSFYLAFDPSDGNKAIAHLLDYDWDVSDWYHRAVYSTNGGVTWTDASGLERVDGFYSRIELAYAPSDPNIVYASNADGGTIWRSEDGGHSYTLRTAGGYDSGVSWYANPLWVDPTDPDFLVTGGYNFYKSTDGGVTLIQISDGYIMTTQPHVDLHSIVHDPGFDGVSNKKIYVGTDGGVWKAENIYTASKTSGWSPLDKSYRSTQYYGAAGDGPSGLILGGTQDNGTLRLLGESDNAILTFGGDGGFCAVDPLDPNYCYGEYIYLQIHRSKNMGLTASYIYNGIGDAGIAANFIAPFVLDPNNSRTMLAGGASLWRTTDVKAATPVWSSIKSPGSANISAIVTAPGNSDIIWVGQNDGKVDRTTNGTSSAPTWLVVDNNDTSDRLPDRYVERILIDPEDSNIVYVAFGGFSTDNLWRTTNLLSWRDITGSGATGLPDAPINGLARHPLHKGWLYVGTEVGIFTSRDDGATWSADNQGPANVSVDELVFMHDSFTLLAATHGRGIFTLEDIGVAALDFDVDGDTDLSDFDAFTDCVGVPDQVPAPLPPLTTDVCLTAFDADSDGDVDWIDYHAFQSAYTGSQ